VFVRVCISDIAFLHSLRDSLLADDEFGRGMAAELQQNAAASKLEKKQVVEKISVDKTHFAERYESSILRLNTLTPHQQEKLDECAAATGDLHIRAPAGAGKTFLALHFIQDLLVSDRRAHVLFAARNFPLTVFVAKWLAERAKGAAARRKLLSRVHLLYAPVGEGVRAVALGAASGGGQTVVTTAASACSKYSLVVVDEAHHIYRDRAFRAALESVSTDRRMLLSDLSQGLTDESCFPGELAEVMLTEVVRSSRRIVAGAMRFQLHGESKQLTKCHHESAGPPLVSFLFDVGFGKDRFGEYATQTVRAIRRVATEFPGLSLHDRLAIIVPDRDFRSRLGPLLERQLAGCLPRWE
jgi:hypothetical protein